MSLLPCLLPGDYPAGSWIWRIKTLTCFYQLANSTWSIMLGISHCLSVWCASWQCRLSWPHIIIWGLQIHCCSLGTFLYHSNVHLCIPKSVRDPPGWCCWGDDTHRKPVHTRDDFGRLLAASSALGNGGQGNTSSSCYLMHLGLNLVSILCRPFFMPSVWVGLAAYRPPTMSGGGDCTASLALPST